MRPSQARWFRVLGFAVILGFALPAPLHAQDVQLPEAPSASRGRWLRQGSTTAPPAAHTQTADPEPVHRFWDRKNVLLFSGVALFRGLDYASTRNMQARGREEILLPDDVANNSAGFAALEAAGA